MREILFLFSFILSNILLVDAQAYLSWTNYTYIGCYSILGSNGLQYAFEQSTYAANLYTSSLNYTCASSIYNAPVALSFRYFGVSAQTITTFSGNSVYVCYGISDYTQLNKVSTGSCPSNAGGSGYVSISALQGIPCVTAYTQQGYNVLPNTSPVTFNTLYTATCASGYTGTVNGSVSCSIGQNVGSFGGCFQSCSYSQTGYSVLPAVATSFTYFNATCASGYNGTVTGTVKCSNGVVIGSFSGCIQQCPFYNQTGYNSSPSNGKPQYVGTTYFPTSCATGYIGIPSSTVQCVAGVNVGSFIGCVPIITYYSVCLTDPAQNSNPRTLVNQVANLNLANTALNSTQIQQAYLQAIGLCAGYNFTGIEYGTQCFCGNWITTGSTVVTASQCAAGNGGTSGAGLGGGWLMSVFSTLNYACYIDSPTNRQLPYNPVNLTFPSPGNQTYATITTAISQCKSACLGYYLAGIVNGGTCRCGNLLPTLGQPYGSLDFCATGGSGTANGMSVVGFGLGDTVNIAVYYTSVGQTIATVYGR